VETRLINQLTKELDKREFQIYERHGKDSQFIFNDKETDLYNLVEHPEWIEMTSDLQNVYMKTMEDFSTQLIGQNYF